MRAARAVWANDLRNIVRDRTVAVLLGVPLLLVAVLRFGVPLLERQVPGAADYRPAMLALFCAVSGLLPALMMSFIMLDERDQDLTTAFRVLPIAAWRFLAYRLVTVAVLGLLFALLVIRGSGLVSYSPPVVLLLGALCALGGPLGTLITVSMADNKIEGLTVFKGLFFLAAVPAASSALPGAWGRVLGVLPGYWTYRAFEIREGAGLAAVCAVSVVFHVAVTAAAARRFRRRAL
ncbi:hypothetical protein [Streptomyces sp. NPDC001933]|uniref:hypothetical protein n=1 Tax=Streptomyces sp. NPDC001933 TaxID=3364626 RepID=UPI003678AE22